jgi:hypothetical protein
MQIRIQIFTLRIWISIYLQKNYTDPDPQPWLPRSETSTQSTAIFSTPLGAHNRLPLYRQPLKLLFAAFSGLNVFTGFASLYRCNSCHLETADVITPKEQPPEYWQPAQHLPPLPTQQHLPPVSTQQHLPPVSTQQHLPPVSTQQHLPPVSTQQHLPSVSAPRNQPPVSASQHPSPVSAPPPVSVPQNRRPASTDRHRQPAPTPARQTQTDRQDKTTFLADWKTISLLVNFLKSYRYCKIIDL